MEYIIVWWIVFGLIAGSVYKKKGKKYSRGFAAGFLLGPIGIILAALSKTDDKEMRKRARDEEEDMIRDGEMIRCSSCSELVQPEATICKHCGRKVFIDLEYEESL